jgi:hypothetical protein
MSAMRVIVVVLLAVVFVSCSGQSTAPAKGDDAANQPAGEEVFEDDFESGKTDEWKAEGEARETPAPEAAAETEAEEGH